MTRRSPQQFLFGTCMGTFILFIGSALLLIFTCSGLLTASEEMSIASNITAERTSWQTKLWSSYGYFIDPGAQTAIESIDSHGFHIFVVVSFSLFGFTWVLLAFGVFIEFIGDLMANLKRRHARISTRDHILVLGWTGKTLFLIRELAQMLTDGVNRGGTIW